MLKPLKGLLFDRTYFPFLAALLLLGELLLGLAIIRFVPYTEIDWQAYMDEVRGFLEGDWDYANLKGDTGPLVYPAGFVYIYSVFFYLTNRGANILMGQYLFLFLYLLQLAVLLVIYSKLLHKIPPWACLLLSVSRRIHSIFMLRLFNDPIALLLFYAALALFLHYRFTLASVFFSLALSVKMNILLFFPGLLFLLLQHVGPWATLLHLALIFAIQVILGAPFLYWAPWSYLSCAFNFGRVFMHKWTVNLFFLPERLFVSQEVARLLLLCHVLGLAAFFIFKVLGKSQSVPGSTPFLRRVCLFLRLNELLASPLKAKNRYYAPDVIVSVFFVCNFIGVVFSRTLHYQFYSWYFHTLPFLLWLTEWPAVVKVAWLLLVEVVWNMYPPSPIFSLVLQACHLTLLAYLFRGSLYREERLGKHKAQ